MRNPTKVHFTTLGSRDYVFQDRAKEKVIQRHSNALKKLRHDYKSLLPPAPQMSTDADAKQQDKSSMSGFRRDSNSIIAANNSNVSLKQREVSYERNESYVTLGNSEKGGDNARHTHMNGTFNMTGLMDERIKPENSKRHKNSDYENYLPKHFEGSANLVAAPYPTDERGRLKKTQVLDHIIKLKRDNSKKIEKIITEKKKQNEETFINYLLEKK